MNQAVQCNYAGLRETLEYILCHKWDILLMLFFSVFIAGVAIVALVYVLNKMGIWVHLPFVSNDKSISDSKMQSILDEMKATNRHNYHIRYVSIIEVCADMRGIKHAFNNKVMDFISTYSINISNFFEDNNIEFHGNVFEILCKEVFSWWHKTSEDVIKQGNEVRDGNSVGILVSSKVRCSLELET